MWAAAGLALSVCTAIFALWRGVRSTQNYYSAQVYGMTAAVHQRYAACSIAFAGVFLAALFVPKIPTVPLLAVYALIVIFYFSSFARGFSEEP